MSLIQTMRGVPPERVKVYAPLIAIGIFSVPILLGALIGGRTFAGAAMLGEYSLAALVGIGILLSFLGGEIYRMTLKQPPKIELKKRLAKPVAGLFMLTGGLVILAFLGI